MEQRQMGSRREPPAPLYAGEATMEGARAVLKGAFGYDSFRPGQEKAIAAVLAGKDALAVMPTGAGKSLCYQIPAALQGARGLTIVVSPLISLMADQVRGLKEVGIRGSYLNSSLNPRQQEIVLARALDGWYDLMYVAPERLDDERFRAFCAEARVPLVAVDEAHCVSQWGQDFRPAYRRIIDFVESLPERPPVLALTATATPQVRSDMVSLLGLRDPAIVVTGFERPNLHLASFELTPKRRRAFVLAYCLGHPDESGIVYAQTRKQVDELAQELRDAGVAATAYHAGYANEDRLAAQQAFARDDVRVMVATNAFGMGIDKPDVRFVINCGMPQTLEEYYQEAGRAGRDGGPSTCVLLWSRGDIRTCHYFIDHADFAEDLTPEQCAELTRHREYLLGEMIGYAMSDRCLRGRVLRYFGERGGSGPSADAPCGSCSVCLHEGPQDLAGDFEHGGGRRAFGMRPGRDGAPSGEEAPSSGPVFGGAAGFEDDEDLYERLRKLRKRLATEQGTPAFYIFSDATLRDMVRKRPATEAGLLQVSGVGRVKLERYGDAFLRVLRGEDDGDGLA